MHSTRSVFISGGGPAGLAAALLFDRMGWGEIVLAEKQASPSDFEKNKSFNYLIEPRGQRMLDRIGVLDRLPRFGVAVNEFEPTTIHPDGRVVTRVLPINDPGRPTCYWTVRRALLAMLYGALEEVASERVRVLYGHAVTGIECLDGERGRVTITDAAGVQTTFTPDLILACDGLGSIVRREVSRLSGVPDGHFEMIASPSISTGLHYKVLNLPSAFTAAGGTVPVDDNERTYIIPSRHKDRRKACQLFAFPVIDPADPRSVNLIREADHELWTIRDADTLLAFLRDSFPQLDIDALVTRQEAEDFVALEPGKFPSPQYARNLSVAIGPPGAQTQVLLVGDAAHAFPPDLGLGVNSALQDLDQLADHLEQTDDLSEAVEDYAAARLPESRDLVYMVQTTFPEQYAHRRVRLGMWAAGFIARKRLHALVPSMFDKPAFYLSQHPTMSFGEMRRRKVRTDRRVRGVGLAVLAMAVAGIVAVVR